MSRSEGEEEEESREWCAGRRGETDKSGHARARANGGEENRRGLEEENKRGVKEERNRSRRAAC